MMKQSGAATCISPARSASKRGYGKLAPLLYDRIVPTPAVVGRLIVSAFVALAAFAQPEGAGSIAGVVVNAATGAPLPRTLVTCSVNGPKLLDANAYTDASGAFVFQGLPPGKYVVHADHARFLHAWYGQASPKHAPATIVLTAGEFHGGLRIALQPLGSISGVVLDPDGDPVQNAELELLASGYDRRKPRTFVVARTSSDDRGRYRLGDLTAGKYFLRASRPYGTALRMGPQGVQQNEGSQGRFARQFYPRADRLSSAGVIQLAPGGDLVDIDFHLETLQSVKLTGRLVVPSDWPALEVFVSIIPQDVPKANQELLGTQSGPPDYKFEMFELLPGPYLLIARATYQGKYYRGLAELEVFPGIGPVTVQLDPGVELSGKVVLEGAPPGPPRPFRVTLVPGDAIPHYDQLPQADTRPDGAFNIPSVPPGVWDIAVEPIPRGGYLKSMLLGGEDVLTEDMVIHSNTKAPLSIVLSARAPLLNGQVVDEEGKPVRGRILLAPAGKFEHVLSFYRDWIADDSGNFEMIGLTPGEYKLYAFDQMAIGAFSDPDFLVPYQAQGVPVTLVEGARTNVQLPIIRAAGGGR
jgi:protocatechuate 3,4-dioxygenase beta subunit